MTPMLPIEVILVSVLVFIVVLVFARLHALFVNPKSESEKAEPLIQTTHSSDHGMEALRLAREHQPDLILMDIQLPEVSGLEVTKRIKEDDNLRSIPVIAVTAFAMTGDKEKIRDGGCEAYIAKPISVTSFMETVQRFLN